MINRNINVAFSYSGNSEAMTIACEYVKYSLEFIGEVKEKTDFSLIENYASNARELIEIKVMLDMFQTMFIARFLQATDKKLTIDNVDYPVVNDAKQVEFELFKETQIGTHPTLKFKCKTPGITTPGITATGDEIAVE